jgi:hypothetical protein
MSYRSALNPNAWAKGECPKDDQKVFHFEGPAADEVAAYLECRQGHDNGLMLRSPFDRDTEDYEMKLGLVHYNNKLCLRLSFPAEVFERFLPEGGEVKKPFKLRVTGSLVQGGLTVSVDPFKGRAVGYFGPNRVSFLYWPVTELGIESGNPSATIEIKQENHWRFVRGENFLKKMEIYNVPQALRIGTPTTLAAVATETLILAPGQEKEIAEIEALTAPPAPVLPTSERSFEETTVTAPADECPPKPAVTVAPPSARRAVVSFEDLDLDLLSELKSAAQMLNEIVAKMPAAQLTLTDDNKVKVIIPSFSL